METIMNNWTKEQCHQEALKYETRWSFGEGSPRHYAKAGREKWIEEICSHMKTVRVFWTFEQCKEEALKYSSRVDFQNGSNNQYQKARKQGWLDDICEFMGENRYVRRSDEQLKAEMQKYTSRGEFLKQNLDYYNQSRVRDWYKDFAQELYGDPIEPGFRKSDFIASCKRNNGGLGVLYLIRCFLGDEWFYKIGITSLNGVRRRYKSNNGSNPCQAMPYNYEIIWEIKGDPGMIWDMENEYKSNTSKIRYQPTTWPSTRSTETFKCHGNCKILRKPDAKNTTVGSN